MCFKKIYGKTQRGISGLTPALQTPKKKQLQNRKTPCSADNQKGSLKYKNVYMGVLFNFRPSAPSVPQILNMLSADTWLINSGM